MTGIVMSLSYTELKPGVCFVKDGSPYVVLTYAFSRKEAQKPVVRLKIRHLVTGKVTEYSAQSSENFEGAEIERKPVTFIYESKGVYWFCEADDKSKRFSLGADMLGSVAQFLKANARVMAVLFEDDIVAVELPIKMDLEVREAPPSVRGNTTQGGTKPVVLETGAKVTTPLFVNQGDVVRVNTSTGEYVERVEKS